MARFIPYQSSRSLIEPTQETINGIESAIRWAEDEVPSQLRKGMNDLCFVMALTNQKFARKMSFGPVDTSQSKPGLAWKLPVRRITEAYYLSWKVKSPRPAVWQLYNDSREAYYIEFGINWLGGNRRVRRPVRKLSLRQTLQYMATTQAYHRVWASIMTSRHAHAGFTQIVQGGGHGVWQDVSAHQADSVIRGNARNGMFSSGSHIGGLRRTEGGQIQQRVTRSSGSYDGPMLGRRLP